MSEVGPGIQEGSKPGENKELIWRQAVTQWTL